MRFCSVADVRNVLAPSGSPEGSAVTLPDDQITTAIEEASAIIYVYLGGRYVLSPTPESLAEDPVRSWTRSIAAFLITLTYKKNQDVTVDDPVRIRYNMTWQQVMDVRAGTGQLDLPLVSETDGTKSTKVINWYYGTLFAPEDFYLGYPSGKGVVPVVRPGT